MKPIHMALLCMTCFFAVAFRTALCDDKPFLPSETQNLTCTGRSNCSDANCTYTQENINDTNIHNKRTYPSSDGELFSCGSLYATTKLTGKFDESAQELVTYTCITYDGLVNFVVMEIIIGKLKSKEGTTASSCTWYTDADKTAKPCVQAYSNETQVAYVAGMPDKCTPYSEPTTTAPPTTTAAPTTASNTTITPDPKDNSTTTVPPKPDITTTPQPSGDGGGSSKDGKDGGADQVKLATAALLTALIATFLSRL